MEAIEEGLKADLRMATGQNVIGKKKQKEPTYERRGGATCREVRHAYEVRNQMCRKAISNKLGDVPDVNCPEEG